MFLHKFRFNCIMSVVFCTLFVGCSKKPPPVVPYPDSDLVVLAEEVKVVKPNGDGEHVKLWNQGELCRVESVVSCPQPIGSGREFFVIMNWRMKGKWIVVKTSLNMDVEDLGDNRYKVSKEFEIPSLEFGQHQAAIKYLEKELGSVDFTINKPK